MIATLTAGLLRETGLPHERETTRRTPPAGDAAAARNRLCRRLGINRDQSLRRRGGQDPRRDPGTPRSGLDADRSTVCDVRLIRSVGDWKPADGSPSCGNLSPHTGGIDQ